MLKKQLKMPQQISNPYVPKRLVFSRWEMRKYQAVLAEKL